MLEEFKKLYNSNEPKFDDLEFVKKAMALHQKEIESFAKEYELFKSRKLNPLLNLVIDELKHFLREGDEVRKLTAHNVANYVQNAPNNIESILLKVKGKIIVVSIFGETATQKIYVVREIKEASFYKKNEITFAEFNGEYLQGCFTECYNYIK